MMELTFGWDDARQRLVREPEAPVATREENMERSKWTRAIREGDKSIRDVGRYKMAEIAYEEREWFQPVKEVPGGAMPIWMLNPTKDAFHQVRLGMRQLKGVASHKELEKLLDRSTEALRASNFSSYVRRVSACEAYNEGAVKPLLMARSVLVELNPSGDAARIKLLGLLLHDWYKIQKPRNNPGARGRQAQAVSKNLGWLSPPWRGLWSRP